MERAPLTFVILVHSFTVVFLLSNDSIILNRWCFTCELTFRMVFQADLEVCCIQSDVIRDNRGSSFSKM